MTRSRNIEGKLFILGPKCNREFSFLLYDIYGFDMDDIHDTMLEFFSPYGGERHCSTTNVGDPIQRFPIFRLDCNVPPNFLIEIKTESGCVQQIRVNVLVAICNRTRDHLR